MTQTVSSVPVTTLAPQPTTKPATIGAGIVATLTKSERVDAVGQGPGDLSGPAVAVTFTVTNDSTAPIALTLVQVTAQDSQGTPASPVSGSPADPLQGQLKPHDHAVGTYVFSLPKGAKSPLTVSISYSAGMPVSQFNLPF